LTIKIKVNCCGAGNARIIESLPFMINKYKKVKCQLNFAADIFVEFPGPSRFAEHFDREGRKISVDRWH